MKIQSKTIAPFLGLLMFLTCFLSMNMKGQSRDSLLSVYNNQTIHSFGRFFIQGSKQITLGGLKPMFTEGVTKDLYNKSKSNLFFGRFLTVTAVAALVTGAIIKKDNKSAALALSIVGIGLNLSSFHFRKKSRELIDQAIWYKNKEILFGLQP